MFSPIQQLQVPQLSLLSALMVLSLTSSTPCQPMKSHKLFTMEGFISPAPIKEKTLTNKVEARLDTFTSLHTKNH